MDCPRTADSFSSWTDVSDFENSSFWDQDPDSGVGGWGDPNNDNQITSGGFSFDFSLVYPSSHGLRRKYSPVDNTTGQPWTALFTPESQSALVNGYVADFIGFQQHIERGSHRAIHRIVGGWVTLSHPL